MGKNQELYERACQVMPGGVNSPVRAYRAVDMAPPFIESGEALMSATRTVTRILTSWAPGGP